MDSNEKDTRIVEQGMNIESKLQQLTEELEKLMNSVPGSVACMRYDNGLIVEYANDKFYQRLNVDKSTSEDTAPVHFEAFMSDKDWKELQEKIEKSMQDGRPLRMEYEAQHQPEWTWHLLHAVVHKQGDVTRLHCSISDISAQKDTECMVDSMIQNMSGGVMRVYYQKMVPEILYLSDTVYQMTGYTEEEYKAMQEQSGHKGFQILYAYEEKLAREAMEARESLCVPPMVCRLVRRDGSRQWIHLRGEVMSRSEDGILIQYALQDFTQMHIVFEEIRKEKQKFGYILEIAADMLFEYDIKKDSMHYTSQQQAKLYEERTQDYYLAFIQTEGMIHPDDKAALQDYCDQMRGGKQLVHVQLRKRFPDRKYHWIELDGRTIYGEDGYADRVIGKITNIDARKAAEEKLRISSQLDSMTGLYNHATCTKKIKQQLALLQPGETCILIICDIDNLKKMNDENGHLFGDTVICAFADELRSIFPDAIKGRIGGDEFLVFVKHEKQEDVEQKLYQLNQRFSKLNVSENEDIHISCSIGAVVCTQEKRDYEKLFKDADNALYQVKRGNKGIFCMTGCGEANLEFVEKDREKEENRENYIREETLINNEEELILFAAELLDSTVDLHMGLKMVSDRICRYYGLDDIVYIQQNGKNYEKQYHWGNAADKSFTKELLHESEAGWDYLEKKYDAQGVAVLTKAEMQEVPGYTRGAMLCVRFADTDDTKKLVFFVDRVSERNWENMKATLVRLANLIYKKMTQMRNEEKKQAELDYRMNYDFLTGLPNYSKFLDLCDRYLKENLLQEDREYYFAYIDFSNFQYMNEVYGYAAGDAVLKRFADALGQFPQGVYFTRVTSDYFVGLLETQGAWVDDFRQYLENFAKTLNKEYSQCKLFLIAGICPVEKREFSVSAVVDSANAARKYGKSTAETSCIFYTDEIRERAENEKNIVARMESALENREFQVYLQPKVNLQSGKGVGAEALVRWRKPDGSMIFPDQFIPLFERNGFVTKVDFYVLEEVLKYLREAIDLGESVVPVSVNFSRRHNEDEHFVDDIQRLLEKYQIDPSLLEAELTESVYMSDLNSLKENVKKIHELGAMISIDDFGSGYSSLNVLSRISADIIKLDKQFLDGGEEGSSPEFIKYLIHMIKDLGYQIIAEGVETKEQVEMLKGANCDMVQGYYYARPMPIAEFRKFLQEFNGKHEE